MLRLLLTALGGATLAVATLTASVLAATPEDWRQCGEGRGDADARQAACTRVLTDPAVVGADRARAHFVRGAIQITKGNPSAALPDLDRAVALKPDDAVYHLWRGRAQGLLGRPDDAIASFTEALRLKPRWSIAHNNRGVALARKGDLDAALAEYDIAIKEEPESLLARKNRGEALEAKGRKAEAIAAFEHVATVPARPGFDEDATARAAAQAHLKRLRGDAAKPAAASTTDRATCERGRGDDRLTACSRLIADPAIGPADRIVALTQRATAFRERRQYETAMADLETLLKLDPDNVAARNALGLNLAELNRHGDAVAQFDRAIQIDPAKAFLYNNRGNAQRNLGRFDKATTDYEEAARREPGFLWPQRNLAYVKERLGLFEEAEAGYHAVLKAAGRPGHGDDRRAKADAADDLKRLVALKEARARSEVHLVKRTALIIANTRYKGSFDPLATPVNDATAVAAALKRIGFADGDVVVRHDLDRKGMIAALREFEAKARAADWAMVFFAGHGVRARSNLDYMIPVDAQVESERDLADEAVALERVVERISDARKLQLVVFDACRSNDLTRRLYAGGESQRSAAQSVAPFDAPGLMLAFSARRGQSAFDGKSNSPFVEALLAHIEKPGIDLETAFSAAAEQVRKVTRDQQVPEIYGLG